MRTPLDIERTVGLSEGNIFAASSSPRRCSSSGPRGWSQYRMLIDGYYQRLGHPPGGCVMGAPGKLAAGQILKEGPGRAR